MVENNLFKKSSIFMHSTSIVDHKVINQKFKKMTLENSNLKNEKKMLKTFSIIMQTCKKKKFEKNVFKV